MNSFRLSCSPSPGAEQAGRVSVLFFATQATDAIRLHLGRNGAATGSAGFDDVRLEEVDDISAYIPLESVRWAGRGFRYDDGGWKVVHIEGAPYERGQQYGELVAEELVEYMRKLGTQKNAQDMVNGWEQVRLLTDSLFLRRYEPEYLEEMRGIADGVNRAGVKFKDRELDVLDIAALNSAVDLGQLESANQVSATALSGRTFLTAEDETAHGGEGDHCSSFVATKKATRGGDFLLGQLFMWNGYTGVHWDVMLDVQPPQGHRFIMQTFPGGIHSGSDWFINDAGLVIGETTVGQTPFNPDGTPQSNRIRKAAQYAASIDEVARLLQERNNGLYTNDWTLADTKTGEGACFTLGTNTSRLWRTGDAGHTADTPGGLQDFIWANNNNRDLEVRKESIHNPLNAPVDLAFNTSNDIPVPREHFQVLSNAMNDFSQLLFVHGTARGVEAGRTLSRQFRDVVADASSDQLAPLVPDAEVTDAELAAHDLLVLGGAEDNALVARLADALPVPGQQRPGAVAHDAHLPAGSVAGLGALPPRRGGGQGLP